MIGEILDACAGPGKIYRHFSIGDLDLSVAAVSIPLRVRLDGLGPHRPGGKRIARSGQQPNALTEAAPRQQRGLDEPGNINGR